MLLNGWCELFLLQLSVAKKIALCIGEKHQTEWCCESS